MGKSKIRGESLHEKLFKYGVRGENGGDSGNPCDRGSVALGRGDVLFKGE